MKPILTFTAFLICFSSTSAQDAKITLQKSFDKCQSINNGYYEMSRYFKSMTKKDTTTSFSTCCFKKLDNDTIFPSAFHTRVYWKGEYNGDVLYTGDDFVTTSKKDSTGRIMSKDKWATDINSIAHNYKFYSPFTNRKSSPMPDDSTFMDTTCSFRLLGEEMINGTSCYRIQVNEAAENDPEDAMQVTRIEFHFWINKEDFLPIQYSTAIDLLMNNDTMYQYELDRLDKYEINQLNNDSILTLASIPEYYQLKDYVPYKSPLPLPLDTLAPEWNLPSLTGENVSLKSLRGNLVLIDFFYKSCYPCMQALPALQALNEKYKDKDVRVIGIDPYDTKDEMDTFLSKRGVTYTILLEGKDAAKDYRVSGYPTMYLVDKSGKIIFVQVGYGKGVDEELSKVIEKNLVE